MLTQIDYGVIAVYAALMTWIGIIAKRKSSNVDQYFAAGARVTLVDGGHLAPRVGGTARSCLWVLPVVQRVTGFSMWTLFFAWGVRGAGARMPHLGAEMVQIESSDASGISGSALRQFRAGV